MDDKKFESISRSQLIERIVSQQKHLMPKDVKDAVRISLDYMSEKLGRGERIEVRKFGSFSIRVHKRKLTRNLKTRETVLIPPRNSPHFKPSLSLRGRVNNSRHYDNAPGDPDGKPAFEGQSEDDKPQWRPPTAGD